MKLYLVKINWYNDAIGEDKIDRAFTFANSYGEACNQINKCYSYINSIKIEEVNDEVDGTILFMPDDIEMIKEIRSANFY